MNELETMVISKNFFYRELHLLCEKIGKKCLNGEEVNLDKEIWHVLDDKNYKKEAFANVVFFQHITFGISYFKPDSEHTNIILTLYFDVYKLKKKNILINVYHAEQNSEDGCDLPTVEYAIDNMFYSTNYCNGECRTAKEKFF